MSELVGSVTDLVSIIGGFAGVIAVAFFIFGAYKYMSASDSSQKVDEAKKAMGQSLFGLCLVLVSFTLVNTLISVVGNSVSSITISQLVADDSSLAEPAQTLGVRSANVVTLTASGPNPAHSKYRNLEVSFSRPVAYMGNLRVVTEHGTSEIDGATLGPGVFSERLTFKVPDQLSLLNHDCFSGAPPNGWLAQYLVYGLLLDSGATIRDEEGRNAIYAFSPTVVEFCHY